MKLCFLQWCVLLLFLLPFDDAFSQFVFEQDIVQGGITAAGFSTGMGSGSGNFDISIEPGSTIKRAYVFSYTQRYPPPAIFTLNDLNFAFDTANVIMNVGFNSPPWPYASPCRLYYKEITNEIDPEITNYNVTIPLQPNLPINSGYWTLFLVVVYENPELGNTAYTIAINDKDLIGNEGYSLFNLNPISPSYPVGFSLYTDRTGSGFTETSKVYFNSNLLGVVGVSDNVNWQWNGAGVKGHFYYQENELFGLDDDIANNTMSGTDGLADVSGYLDDNAASCAFQLRHINYPNQAVTATNINLAYTLAYTTPCLPFETTLTEEIEICRGDNPQLLATGGIDYEWLPEEDLSCYNCPNPVFEGDSSKVYTVRIWNTDSCSKVLPVKVNVLDVPTSATITTTTATCGLADGGVSFSNVSGGQPQYLYTIGGNWTTNPSASIFNNQFGGDYTLTIKDSNGCIYEQDFTIPEENPAWVDFTANPQSGNAPLDVSFTNQSNDITDHEWMIENNFYNDFDVTHTFDSAGTYPIQLIGWHEEPHCADTATTTIIVHPTPPPPPDYSHSIEIPEHLSSPEDNAFFVNTRNVQRVEIQMFNAIGQHIFSQTFDVADGKNYFWNGSNHARGYYFYRIKYWDVQGLEYNERGKVLVIR